MASAPYPCQDHTCACLGQALDRTEEWARQLMLNAEDQVLEQLGFLHSGALAYTPPNGDPSVVLNALRHAVHDMRDAASCAWLPAATVQAVNKVKHGFLAVSIGKYVKGQLGPDEAVVVLYTVRALGRIQRAIIEATDAKVHELVEKLQRYADVSACLLMSYLCVSTGGDPDHAAFPSQKKHT